MTNHKKARSELARRYFSENYSLSEIPINIGANQNFFKKICRMNQPNLQPILNDLEEEQTERQLFERIMKKQLELESTIKEIRYDLHNLLFRERKDCFYRGLLPVVYAKRNE